MLTRGGFLALVPLALPFALVLNGLALYGFHTSLGGKPAFGRILAED